MSLRTLCLLVPALLVSLVVTVPAHAAGTTLQGTISWSTTITTETDDGETALSSKETRKVTLKVRMTKRSGAAGWQPEDNGSSYRGTYTLSATRRERDADGAVSCTTTHVATGSGAGALPRKPRSTTAPSLFASILPVTPRLGSKTKAIVLTPILRYRGEDRVTSEGGGLSPCQPGTDVDPIDGSLAPTDSAQQVCLPKGTSRKTTPPQAGTLLGAWKNASRRFAFTCADSWSGGDGQKVATKIQGSLRLR